MNPSRCLAALAAVGRAQEAAKKELEKLNGEWQLVSAEKDGKKITPGNGAVQGRQVTRQ